MPELSTEKGRNCRNKIEKGRKFLNLKIRRTRMKKVHHFQTARFDTLSERRWQSNGILSDHAGIVYPKSSVVWCLTCVVGMISSD